MAKFVLTEMISEILSSKRSYVEEYVIIFKALSLDITIMIVHT